MLPKTNRLAREKDFARLFKFGKFFKENFIALRLVQNNIKKNRATVVVSSKVFKKATQRNKAKRLIRQELHQFFKGKNKIKSYDAMFLIQKPFLKKDYPVIKEQVAQLLKMSKLLE